MLTKSKMAVAAAILLGSVTGAVASDTRFDVDIYRPAIQGNALDARAQAVAPAAKKQAPSVQELQWFDRVTRNSQYE